MNRLVIVVSLLGCALALTWAGTVEVIEHTDCDGAVFYDIFYLADPSGLQRASLAHMVPAETGTAQVDRQFIEIETTRVELAKDTVLTLFYQTDPTYRAMLGPHDTWVAYSATRLELMEGFVALGFEFSHGIAHGGSLVDTRYVQFALVPWTFSETSQLADSVANHLRFRLSDGGPSPVPSLVENTFVPRENGRIISHLRAIPTSAGGGYSGPVYFPKAGDLVITEIMADPNGGVADATGEWFEVTNVSNVHLNLDGVAVKDNGSELFRNPRGILDEGVPVILPPGGIAVYGASNDPRTNGGVGVEIGFGDHLTLGNNSDAIVLFVDGEGEIDRVEYSTSWNIPSGKSIELTDTSADNNNVANWAVAARNFGHKGHLGTPGSAYNVTALDPPLGDPGIPLDSGMLVVTEISSQPWGEDDHGEWFEVFNPLDTPVILTDLVVEMVSDTGSIQSFRITKDLILDPRSYMTFAREDKVSKGGLPLGHGYKNAFAIHNDVGTLRLKYNSLTVDEVAYNGNGFPGFPDYGDAIAGGWPLPSEYDGRTMALQGSWQNLRDTITYDNNSASNWALSPRWRQNGFGRMLAGTPGKPNVEDGNLGITGGPSAINSLSSETFRVTITPPTGYGVSEIDEQSIRLFWRQRPLYIRINASSLEADFRKSDVPWHISRNEGTTAYLTAAFDGDTAIRFVGTWSVTIEDTTRPTPAAISTPQPGEIKIVEIMVNAAGNDGDHEYIEILNMTSNKTFDLTELGVGDGGGSTMDPTPEGRSRIYNRGDGGPLRLGPGQVAAIGRNHTGRFLGFAAKGSMLNQDLDFAQTGDQVVVFRLSDNVAIAEVDYEAQSAGFPNQNSSTVEGRSLSLIDTGLDPAKGANWINATIPFRLLTDTSYGTPGAPNRIASRIGDLYITEVYPDPPPGGEPNTEFFEIWNPDTTAPLDLAGLIVTDDAGNQFTLDDRPGLTVSGGPQQVHIPTGGVFVLGNSRGASDGVDATFGDTFGAAITRYDYPNSWTLVNSGDAVRIVRNRFGDSTVIASMSYTSSSAGKSWAIESLNATDSWVQRAPNPTVAP